MIANGLDDDVSILLWNAILGDWDAQITRSVGDLPINVFIGDADNDGLNDIVTTNLNDDDVSILLWNATSGDWDLQITRPAGDRPRGVFIEDADNDGLNDIVTANSNDDNVSILLWNATSGDWDPQITRSVGNYPDGVFIEDADNDGLNDIVTANVFGDSVSILLWNATSGDWDPQISRSVGVQPGIVFIGDANNDAWNDIVVSNTVDDNVSILLWNAPIPTITIDTPENITYIEPMSGYYPAVFGFENQLSGVMPNDWIIAGSSGTGYLRTVDELDGHKKVLDFYSGANGDHCYYEKDLKMNVTNGTIEFWFQTTDVSPPTWYSWFMLSDGISMSERNIRLCIRDGTLTFANGTDYLLVDPIVSNQWYHLRIDFNMIANTSTIYLNNVLKLSNVNNWGKGSQINTIQVTNHYNLANTHLYLDAIGYSWDPHYNIGDNLEEGLLLSFENNIFLDWMGYSLDGQTNITILGNTTIPMLEDGPHTVQVFGNTSTGFMVQSDIRHFSIDTEPPEIIITSPSQNQFIGSETPNFDISIVEPNLNTTWYTLDDGLINKTFTGLIGTIDQIEWDKKGHGAVTIRFYANDSFGGEGYAEVVINKDLNPPTSLVSFIPHKGINEVNRSTAFILTAADGVGSGVSVIRYKINNTGWVDYTGPFDLSIYAYGDYIISYQAIDLVNNIETENTLLVRLVELPSELSEQFDMTIIITASIIGGIGLAIAITIIFIRKRK